MPIVKYNAEVKIEKKKECGLLRSCFDTLEIIRAKSLFYLSSTRENNIEK